MGWQFKSDWVANPRPPDWSDLAAIAKDQGRAGFGSWGGDVDAGAHSLLNLAGAAGGYGQSLQFTSSGRVRVIANANKYGLMVQYSSAGGSVCFGAADASTTPDAVICNAGGAELARFANSGNVGIGTNNPTSGFMTKYSATGDPSLVWDSFAPVNFRCEAGEMVMGMYASSPYAWYLQARSGGAPKILAINPLGGSVGIGTESPSAPLHVKGGGEGFRLETVSNVGAAGALFVTFYDSSGARRAFVGFGGTNNLFQIYNDTGGDFSIGGGGHLIQPAPAAAVSDGMVNVGQMSVWYDEGNNRLVVRTRSSAGVLKTGYLSVA